MTEKDGLKGVFDLDDQLTPEMRKQKGEILHKPVNQVKLTATMTVADLVEQMSGMSIQARNIGSCGEVLKKMMLDKRRPTVFLALAGPLIAAGLRQVIVDLIVNRVVDVVVSTGAILYQDIYQARGSQHYVGTPNSDDVVLHDLRIDRIYDTYVDEEKFWETDEWCGLIADEIEPGNYSSRQYMDFVGSKLSDENSIVYNCHKYGVPIFAPALNDSSIGIGLTAHRIRAIQAGRKSVCIDAIQDNHEILQLTVKSPATSAIYVAGGVPKNYVNDSIVMAYLYGLERGHDYAIQVTTAVTADGGLSSSTLGEAQSWGKIDSDAHFAMAWVEPSVAVPLLAAYVFGRDLAKDRPRLKWTWDGETLVSLGHQ